MAKPKIPVKKSKRTEALRRQRRSVVVRLHKESKIDRNNFDEALEKQVESLRDYTICGFCGFLRRDHSSPSIPQRGRHRSALLRSCGNFSEPKRK